VRAAPGAALAEIRQRPRTALPTPEGPFRRRVSIDDHLLLAIDDRSRCRAGRRGSAGRCRGGIIVAQTVSAATVERLSEFATLRAIGASNAYLNSIVLKQALTGGAIGYLLGIAAAAMLVRSAADSTVSLVLAWQMAAAITLALCSVASLTAIHSIKSIAPTIVFR